MNSPSTFASLAAVTSHLSGPARGVGRRLLRRSEERDARRLVERALERLPSRRFAVRWWDGELLGGDTPSDVTLVVRTPRGAHALVAHDAAAIARAYVTGALEVEGDVERAVEIARTLQADLGAPARARWPGVLGLRRSLPRQARDVRAHYDLSDAFFALFLDERMVYSCAYFREPTLSLARAQEEKLDLICRKLDLQPGETLLDVGCGWGALLIWAAEHYGVRGHGITLSENQVTTARARIAAAGLSSRLSVERRHYDHLPAASFDKVASVGMYEHVGLAHLNRYFGHVLRTLKPGGLFLNHGITRSRHAHPASGGSFILDEVFPGAELEDVSATQRRMERVGFELVDVHGLRPHYARTLREWSARYRARREDARRLVGERVARTWDVYLPGCAAAFEDDLLGVYQVLAARPGEDRSWRGPMDRTRAFSAGDDAGDHRRNRARTDTPGPSAASS